MKNNTFKRVMAGTLAVLTVASPMTANVGGFLTGGSAIVANAVDAKIDATERSMYSAINSSDGTYKWAVGDYFEEKAVLTKATTDTTHFTLRVPLTQFANTKATFDETAPTDLNFNGNPDDSSSVYTDQDNFMCIQNVEKVEYTPTLADSTVVKELKITYSFTIQGTDTTAFATRTFRVKDKYNNDVTNNDPGDATKYFISVADVYANGTTVTLGREDVKDRYVFQFKDARQYIESISYTFGGVQTVISGSQVTSNTLGIEVDSKTPMTIVTTALLRNNGRNYFANYTPTYADGKYTYVINAVRDYQDVSNDTGSAVTTIEKIYTIQNGTSAEDKRDVYIQRKTDSEPVYCDGNLPQTAVIQAGSTVTITADSPFFIENGQITGQNEDGTFQTADVKGVYTDGKFTATFVASNTQVGNTILLSAMPTHLEYSGLNTNKMTATSTDEEEGIVVNALVASVSAYVKTPVYVNNDPTQGFMKGKDQFTGETGDLYNYTEIAANGNTTYSKDLNADVVLKFALDNNMLVKDTDGKSYFVEITDANKKVVANYTYKPNEVDDKKFVANGDLKLINGDANGFSVSTKNAGTYNITVSVWGAGDNKVRNLNYSYTVNPATMTADDLTPIAFYTGTAASGDLDASKKEFVALYEELVTAKQEYYKDPQGNFTVLTYNDLSAKLQTLRGLTKVDMSDNCVVWDTYTENDETLLSVVYQDPETKTYYVANYGTLYQATLNETRFEGKVSYDFSGMDIMGNILQVTTIPNANRVAQAQDAYDAFLADPEKAITNITKNDDGVWEVPVNADKLKTAKTATFYAVVDPELAVNALRVNGDEKTSIINGEPGSATLQVMDANYGGSETAPKNFEFKWKLVDEVVEDNIYFSPIQATSTADAAEFASVVKNALRSTNGIDVSNATFKYTLTKQAGGMIDIDSMTMNLPTDAALEKLGQKMLTLDQGQYITVYVYATVGSLETANPLAVTLTNEATKTPVNAVLNKLTYTYGEVISPEDLFFVEQGKDTKIDALTTTDNTKLHISWKEADFTTVNGSKVYNKDSGVYTFNNTTINQGTNAAPVVLAPGIYQITIENCTNLSDELYQFVQSSVAESQETIKKTFIIEVKKRTVESYMVSEVQLPLVNGEARVNNNTFTGPDVPGGLLNDPMTFSIVGKKTSATTPGRYTVTIEPSGETANYYEGEVDVTWCATGDQSVLDTYDLRFNDENSNIYKDKNGVQIHVDAYIFNHDDMRNLTTKDLQGDAAEIKVAKYGFLYEKAGKLAEYTADNPTDLNIVRQKMRLGQGILTTNATMKDTSGNPLLARTGINSVVKSIDDYIWLRPYLVTEDGVTLYGEPARYDFTTVAQQAIAPEIGRAELVQKDGSIYYYAYASKHTKNDEEKIDGIDRTAIPDAFGVVIDRGDNYAPLNNMFTEAATYAIETTMPNTINAMLRMINDQANADEFSETKQTFTNALRAMYSEYTKNATNSINNYQSIYQLKTIDESFNKMIAIAKRDVAEGNQNSNQLNTYITQLQEAYNNSGVQAIAEEYLGVADKLTLDTCDVKSKAMSNNEYYNQDECGTLIRITDSLSNVYVRTYVDFGEGLVVYSDPQGIESASAQLSRVNSLNLHVYASTHIAKSGDLYQMVAQRNLAPSTVTLKAKAEDLHAKTGKIQSFEAIQYVTTGKTDEAKANMATEYGLVIDKTGEVTMKGNTKKLVLGEGFIDLKSSKPNADTLSGTDWNDRSYAENNAIDFGAITTVANASVSARAYMVFKGVTIYSKPVTSGLNDNNVKLYTGDVIVEKGTPGV